MELHPNGLPFGTTRRAPSPGFAHATLIDPDGDPRTWLVVDLYGPTDLVTDNDVATWPVVYQPTTDSVWADQHPTPSAD